MNYRVFHSGVDWHITYNISETYVCIKTKFCTCVHELFTSNFCFNNFFLRPLTLAVLIRYYVHFDDFLKAFYVFLKFSPFWNCPRIFRYFIGCKLIFFSICMLINMPWHLLDHTGSFWTKNEWPPSSPDCNPMNYAIWSILESRDCAQPHSSVNMLKASMKKTWSEIMPEVIVRSIVRLCAQFPDRLEKLFLNNSGQFACMFGSNKIFNF